VRITGIIRAVHPGFPEAAFLRDALDGYQALELTPRARLIAQSLARHVLADYERAVAILVSSLGPPLPDPDEAPSGMGPLVYLPYVYYGRARPRACVTRASTCDGWCPRKPARGCPGRRAGARWPPTRRRWCRCSRPCAPIRRRLDRARRRGE
jgi:hypothetical protein